MTIQVFPTWRGSFDGIRPSVQGLDRRRLADAITVGLLTGAELDGLMKLVETPSVSPPSLIFLRLGALLT